MTKETPRTEPVFPPESRRTQDERCKAGLEHNKPRRVGGEIVQAMSEVVAHRKGEIDLETREYPDRMTRPDGSKQGDRDE